MKKYTLLILTLIPHILLAQNTTIPEVAVVTKPLIKEKKAPTMPTIAQNTKNMESSAHNRLSLGGNYAYSATLNVPHEEFHSGGSYISIETKYNNPYVAMLNTFTFTYLNVDKTYLNLAYAIGLRSFLATQYLFIDTTVEVSYAQSLKGLFDQGNPGIALVLGLGVNIPLTQNIFLQVSGYGKVGVGKAFKTFGAFTAIQFDM